MLLSGSVMRQSRLSTPPRRSSDSGVVPATPNIHYELLLSSGWRERPSRLLASGIRIVDDDRSTDGTANLDDRSLFIHYEFSLAADCRSLYSALATIIENGLNESIEVRRIPWSRAAIGRKNGRIHRLECQALAVISTPTDNVTRGAR